MIEFAMSFLLVLPVVGITVLCFVFGYDLIAKYVKDEPKPRKHKKHGVRCNMCEFCKDYGEDRIFGSNIPIKKCANKTELTHAYILKNRGDKIPGIVIGSSGMTKGYFDIMYCPICGRKL